MNKVVIGAGYGDEGKGLVTNYFVHKAIEDGYTNSMVVRYSGGAQCSHTTVLPNGTKHIHSHFGCGTLHGVPTFLSKYMVINVDLFLKELETLNNLKANPYVYVDCDALATTPFDMMINQLVENKRAEAGQRHGSCGIGVNETVTRSFFNDDFKIRAIDLFGGVDLEAKLWKILNDYVSHRLKELDIFKEFYDQFDGLIKNIIIAFLQDTETFSDNVELSSVNTLNNKFIIFEGSQGLAIDEELGQFPHVTRSIVGLPNVISIMNEMRERKLVYDRNLETVYVTRWYNTRHGAGPLENEIDPNTSMHFEKVVENTNITNKWQGKFKFGLLNDDYVTSLINKDMTRSYDENFNIITRKAITCLDQVSDNEIPLVHNHNIKRVSLERLFKPYLIQDT